MLNKLIKPRLFFLGLLLLTGIYLSLQLFLNEYTMFAADEFWFAHHVYKFKDQLPYRDFAPYKTVLGYYLLLPFLLITDNFLTGLAYIKNGIAMLNAIILLLSALWLKRFFAPLAILISLTLLISAETVLAYSTNIRVDLLAYWFCYFSLLALLNKRVLLAGIFLGLGFITSQKAIWCWIACNVAYFAFLFDRTNHSSWLKNIIYFNVSICIVIASYIMFWGNLADFSTVFNSLFTEAYTMYQLDWYADARYYYWYRILILNPLFFFLTPALFFSFLISFEQDSFVGQRIFISIYALLTILMLVPYKQIFPYYLQIAIPAFFLSFAALFSWFMSIQQQKSINIYSKTALLIFSLLYLATIIIIIYYFQLPSAYYLMCALPFLLSLYLLRFNELTTQNKKSILQILAIAIIFVGIIYPGILTIQKTIAINSEYQHTHLAMMNNILREGGDYLAGVDLIYKRDQPIPGLRHLNGPSIDYLYHPSMQLRAILMPSLDQDPTINIKTAIEALMKAKIKFYVNNYRIEHLPPVLKRFMQTEYEHYWGSIYIYAPLISPGTQHIHPKFAGLYLIETEPKNIIKIADHYYHANSTVFLKYNQYAVASAKPFRLKFIPKDAEVSREKNFSKDQWEKIII